MLIALTRDVSPAIGRCELTHVDRQVIDVDRARAQHRAYEQALATLGCRVERVAPAPDLPDSVFVVDTAVVLDEVAVLARPGAASRRPELDGVADCLARFRPLVRLEPPGTLDGGDVLVLGRRVFVGRSTRTSDDAIAQLDRALRPLGYEVQGVEVNGCLHLKSAASAIGPGSLLVNAAWVAPATFAGLDLVEVDPAEPHAGNVLWVGGTVLMPAAHARTRRRLEARGLPVMVVDVSELAKAEGGVTCCSIVLAGPGAIR